MRNLYSAQFTGLNIFQKHRDTVLRNSASQIGKLSILGEIKLKSKHFFVFSLESIKKSLTDTLAKPDGNIFQEDLKTALYSAKSDADIDLVKNSIKR